MKGEELIKHVSVAADDKRAKTIIALDMQGISLIADYFMICHGSSEKQVQAIARGVKEAAEEQGIEIKRLEGFDKARWILVDLGDVVVHVFHKEERDYYNLEKLWGDAPRVNLEGVLQEEQ